MANSVLIVIKIPTVEQQALESYGKEDSCNTSVVIATNKHGAKFIKSTLPVSFVPLKEKLEEVLQQIKVKDVTWQLTENEFFWRVCFTCELEETDSILELLASMSIGSYKGTYVGILPFSFILKDDELMDQVFDAEDEQREHLDDQVKGSAIQKGQFINPGFVSSEEGQEFDSTANTLAKVSRKLGDFKNFQERFLRSITARLTVAQVAASVRAGSDLTFDFFMYIIMASWIAAMGLMEDSIVSLVAAMLVSPLMGSVLAMTFGTIVRNKEIRNLGAKSLTIGMLIALSFGYFFGLIAYNFLEQWHSPQAKFPTSEMRSRGELRNLWVGALVALPSGAAVALSLLSGAQASLIGVAISASLLPPCVNAGLLWSHATIQLIRSMKETAIDRNITGTLLSLKPSRMPRPNYEAVYYPEDILKECAILGLVSIGLTVVNVISMFVSGLLFLKIKEITPEAALSPSTARFFKQDIKIARQYNQSKTKGQTLDSVNSDMGQEILREWVDANGLSTETILSSETAASKVIREHTLADILADVQNDQVFQSVRRGSVSLAPAHPDLMVRFSSRINSSLPRRRSLLHPANVRNSYTSGAEWGNIPLVELNQSRKASVALRETLKHSDHLPYSVWPKARKPSILVTPPNEHPLASSSSNVSQFAPDSSKFRRMSRSALHSYQEEMKKQTTNSRPSKDAGYKGGESEDGYTSAS